MSASASSSEIYANGGQDKVKVLDSVKRKFFSANTLLPMGEKLRSQSRAKSTSRLTAIAFVMASRSWGSRRICRSLRRRRVSPASASCRWTKTLTCRSARGPVAGPRQAWRRACSFLAPQLACNSV